MKSLRFQWHPVWMVPAALIILLVSSFSYLHSQQPPDFGLLSPKAKLSPVLADRIAYAKASLGKPGAKTLYPVIVQLDEQLFESVMARSRSVGLASLNSLPSIHGFTARLGGQQIESLAQSEQVEYITLDVPILPLFQGNPHDGGGFSEAFDLYRKTVGAEGIRAPRRRQATVAVFDSGIDQHFRGPLSGKVCTRADFTSDRPVFSDRLGSDEFGHGTHVAGIIDGITKGGQEFVDVRVIGPEGWGLTSNLIRAIGWVIENKDLYDIRIANLSLGHPPIESYRYDPLCQAVRRMVDAGIVTIVSAGNLGKTEIYPKVWGGVTSPGIEPSVITVGPINTHGTLTHRDDSATSFGSRGPSIDGFFKPDLVAPGNQIPSLLAVNSWIGRNYPELIIDPSDLAGDSGLIRLSGSSMATAFTTGAAVQMLRVNQDLTPHLVKLILNLSASKLSSPSILEQGNGMLNVWTAVELARQVDVVNRSLKQGVSPVWLLGERNCNGRRHRCEEVWAGGAFAFGNQAVYSQLVAKHWQGELWGSGLDWKGGLVQESGFFWADEIFQADGFFWADGTLQADGPIAWTDGFFWADGIFWADGFFWSDGIFWADGVIWSDALLGAQGNQIVSDTYSGDSD